MANRFGRIFGKRDPQVATTQQTFVGLGQMQIPEWDAERAYKYGYILNSFVYAAINAIATDLASVPFRTHQELPDDPTTPHDFDTSSALAQLLGPPPGTAAPKLSARTLWRWSVAQRQITGRLGWEIESNSRGVPVALWPLVSMRLNAVPSKTGAAWFSEFRYIVEGGYRPLTPDEVFYSWHPSQHDFRQPESPLQAARLPIDLAVDIDRYNLSFMKNDATPALMVTHQRIDDTDNRDAWRDKFRGNHQGVDKAGGVIFTEVDAGVDGKVLGTVAVERLGMSQRDAQLAQQYSSSIQAILVALGVPLSRLMDASGRTFANASEESKAYWNSTIKPLALELADDVNAQLAPRLGNQYGWFDMSDLEIFKPAESQPFANSDLPTLVSSGLVSAAWAAEQIGAPTEGLSVKPASDATPAVGKLSARRSDRAEEESRQQREVKAVNKRVDQLEKVWLKSFIGLFNRQEASVLSKLDSSRGRKTLASIRADVPNVDQIFNETAWVSETSNMADDMYRAVGTAAVLRITDNLSPSTPIDPVTERVVGVLTTKSMPFAGQVTGTTKGAIRDQLVAGVSGGEGIDLLAARVRKVFAEAKGYRSELIARTEVIGSYNQASVETAKALPSDVADAKQWLATNDMRTRPGHTAADGQIRNLSDPFSVDGIELQQPSQPNCRCTVLIGLRKDLA